MVGGIKKLIKKDTAHKALSWYLPFIINCIYLYGKVGKGKTTTMLSMALKYHDILKYKLFYMWGGDRNEHLYISLPSMDNNYWDKLKKMFSLKGEGPKQYKIHFLYPHFEKGMPKKLPNYPPYVKSSIFTIPMSKVNGNNIMHVIGNFGENDSYVWRESSGEASKSGGPKLLLEIAEDISRKNQTILRNFIKPLCKNKLLQSDDCSYNIDLMAEFEDRETITVFCLEFIPEDYKIFVLEWILSEMARLLDKIKGKSMTDNLLMVNESAEFFRATDDSIMPERYKVFRRSLSNYLRMGRRGMKFMLNCQSVLETRGMVSGQEDSMILCGMTSPFDIEMATDHLRKNNLMRKDQIEKLYKFKPGQFLYCKGGEPARSQYYFKPRTLYWQPGMGDFYKNTWGKLRGWENIIPQLKEIDEIYENKNKEIDKIVSKFKEKIKEDPKENISKEYTPPLGETFVLPEAF